MYVAYINSGGFDGFQYSQTCLCYSDIEINFLVIELCKLDQTLEESW